MWSMRFDENTNIKLNVQLFYRESTTYSNVMLSIHVIGMNEASIKAFLANKIDRN